MTYVVLLLTQLLPLGWLYADPPPDAVTPVVRAAVLPVDPINERWVSPPAPSAEYARKQVNKGVGVQVLTSRLHDEKIHPAREYPKVGVARLWTLTYEYRLLTPAGPSVLYLDRAVLVVDR